MNAAGLTPVAALTLLLAGLHFLCLLTRCACSAARWAPLAALRRWMGSTRCSGSAVGWASRAAFALPLAALPQPLAALATRALQRGAGALAFCPSKRNCGQPDPPRCQLKQQFTACPSQWKTDAQSQDDTKGTAWCEAGSWRKSANALPNLS